MGQSVGDLTLRMKLQSDAKDVLARASVSATDLQKAIGKVEANATKARDAMKGLVGSDAAVVKARKEIGAQLKAEKNELGQLKLKLLEVQNARKGDSKGLIGGALSGVSKGAKGVASSAVTAKKKIADLAAAIKKLPTSVKGVAVSVREQGAKGLAKKGAAGLWERMKGADKGAGNAASALASKAKDAASALAGGAKNASMEAASNVASMAVGGFEAATVGAVVAIPGLLVGLGALVTKMGDAERSSALAREGLMGTAEQGQALGTWVDGLARKFPVARAEIQATALSLRKAGLGGDALTTSLEATTAAQAALGSELGSKVSELTTRYQRQNRFMLGALELEGTGLKFEDVAQALGKSTKRGVANARRELMSGKLSVSEGAAAMRDAINAKFGNVIEGKKLSLDAIGTRAKDNFSKLFAAVKIEPILKFLSKMVDFIDTGTTSGKAAASVFNSVADIFGHMVGGGGSLPKFEEFMLGAEMILLDQYISALDLYIAFQKVGDAIKDAGVWLGQLKDKTVSLVKHGQDLAAGFARGIRGGTPDVKTAAGEMVGAAKGAVEKEAEIHSPSRLTARLGKRLPEGFALGIEAGLPGVARASQRMVDVPAFSGANGGFANGGRNGGGGERTINVTLQLPPGSTDSPEKLATAMSAGQFRAMYISALRDMAMEAP